MIPILNAAGYKTEGEGNTNASYIKDTMGNLISLKNTLIKSAIGVKRGKNKLIASTVAEIECLFDTLEGIIATFAGENFLSFSFQDDEGKPFDMDSAISNCIDVAKKVIGSITEDAKSRADVYRISQMKKDFGWIRNSSSETIREMFNACPYAPSARKLHEAIARDPNTPDDVLDRMISFGEMADYETEWWCVLVFSLLSVFTGIFYSVAFALMVAIVPTIVAIWMGIDNANFVGKMRVAQIAIANAFGRLKRTYRI